MRSRAVIILGMHRSGTSLLARGVQSLGVYLGDIPPNSSRSDNPTGYWEDQFIFSLNERVLRSAGLDWRATASIGHHVWRTHEIMQLRNEAVKYISTRFSNRPLWGFKDPRTIRVLPFWREVFSGTSITVNYLIAIRHPSAVVMSLHKRRPRPRAPEHLLWLMYMVPHLAELANAHFTVVDYDLLLDNPEVELRRIENVLALTSSNVNRADADAFCRVFVNPALRHARCGMADVDFRNAGGVLAYRAYCLLRKLAVDELDSADGVFWSSWGKVKDDLERLSDCNCLAGTNDWI